MVRSDIEMLAGAGRYIPERAGKRSKYMQPRGGEASYRKRFEWATLNHIVLGLTRRYWESIRLVRKGQLCQATQSVDHGSWNSLPHPKRPEAQLRRDAHSQSSRC